MEACTRRRAHTEARGVRERTRAREEHGEEQEAGVRGSCGDGSVASGQFREQSWEHAWEIMGWISTVWGPRSCKK